MKCAIFYDYFGAIGGAERVIFAMAKILGADIITTDLDAVQKIDPDAHVISIGETTKIPPLKQISATVRFRGCNYGDDYDFFIFSGNWSYAAAYRHHPNLWYCYTPARAFYDLYPIFLTRQDIITRQAFRSWVLMHRWFDQRSVRHIDRIIAISQNVQQRVKQYHHRDADVIYPPVDTARYRCIEYGDFWLSVNRMYPEKRIELQIEAFRKMPDEQLIIVGGYAKGDNASGYAHKIMHDLPPNITYLGEVEEEELIRLYSRCKAHVCTALDEDFGLTPLEAMASGKPVVAVNEGGYCETVTGETGMIIEARVDDIIKAVRLVALDPSRYREACIERARAFDLSLFSEQLKAVVNEKTKKRIE